MKNIFDIDGRLLAIYFSIEKSDHEGVKFLTSESMPFQLGIFNHPAGHQIQRHFHKPFLRETNQTCEFLHVRSGMISASIYDSDLKLVETIEVSAGESLALLAGGHEFEIIETTEIIEVKSGPYAGDQDKEFF